MRDSIETFSFIQKYHQDLDVKLHGLRASKPIHELTGDRRDWVITSRFAMIVLRDIGCFMLGIEQPQVDCDFDDDPFTDIGKFEVERKAAEQQNQQGEVCDDLDRQLASVMRQGVARGIAESTGKYKRCQRSGKLLRLFRGVQLRPEEH